ncbi:relaxase/mobilization nuclease domain-containing protein [Helicobacter pylori]
MLVKFWGIKQGGGDGDGSVNYLLNERVEQGTAKVLRGDANLTKSLLLSLTQKHKACVGCLSFEESNINESLKYELMESFENALLTQEMQGRYNILWVEHTEKGRLELNFVIPRIDLIIQKAFTPYYHSADITRIDLWKDCINLKHNFTNPKNIEKQHNIQQHQTKNLQNKELLATYEKLDKLIQDNLGTLFNSRADIINFLKDNQCEVTRQGKDYISVKLSNEPKAKRLKGFYYHETFKTIKDIRNQLSEARQRENQRERSNSYTTNNNHAELLRELENKLHRHIEYKQQYYKQLHEFNSKEPREPKEQLPRARENQQEIQGNYTRGSTRARETNPQEPSQEILTNAPNFHYGASYYGGNISGGILSNHSTQQKQGIRAFTERSLSVKTRNRPTKQRQSTENLRSNTDQEIREKMQEEYLNKLQSALISEVENLQNEKEILLKEKNSEIESLENDKNELLIKLEKVTEEFQRLSKNYERLETETLNLKESYETLSQTHNTLLAKLQALERAERAELNQLMQTLEQKEISLKNNLQTMCERILQQELQNAQIKEQEISQAQYKELKTQLEILETTLKQELEQSYTTFMQEHETQLTQLKTSTETQKNELETSFKEQMSDFQGEWNKKQESFMQKQHNWIERLENTIKK